MKFWAHETTGRIAEYSDDRRYVPQAENSRELTIDQFENVLLVRDMVHNTDLYHLSATNVLRRSGVIVTIAPPGPRFLRRVRLWTVILPNLRAGIPPAGADLADTLLFILNDIGQEDTKP